MSLSKPDVLEPYARHLGSAMLVINPDGSWSIGNTLATAVKIKYDSLNSLDDTTFGWSAVAAESDGAGGYRFFVRNDLDEDLIVEVRVDAAGRVDPASLAVLSAAQMYAVEELFKVDLNQSGGFGSGPVLLQGGAVNLYMNELGHYQIGSDVATLKTLTLGGVPLDDELLPAGWDIVELVNKPDGFNIFAQDPSGVIYNAVFDANGAYTGGDLLLGAALETLEQTLGLDIDGNNSLPAAPGWTSSIVTPSLRTAVEAALTSGTTTQNALTHSELVGVMQTVIAGHKAANTPVSAQEVADLQAMAARGSAIFAGNGATAGDYLSFVFSRMVEGSEANRFFNGGTTTRSELGSLGAGSSVTVLEKLVDKWLLGGDAPSPATAGDAATGAAKSVVATYAKATGPLFVDGVSVTDVVQGTAGTCYLIAAMGGLAYSQPQALEALFVDNGAIDGGRSWGVRFFDAKGKAQWVTVNDMVPVAEVGANKVAYAGSASKALDGELWVTLLEKAYAQANTLGFLPRDETTGLNSFGAIEGGAGDPLGAIIAGKVISFSDPGSNYGKNDYLVTRFVDRTNPAQRDKLEADLKGFMNAGKTIWVGVEKSVKDAFGNQLLVGGHAHFLIDADRADPNNNTALVYNPWGIVNQPTPPGPTPGEFISPVAYTLTQLVGIPGLDFMVLDGPLG